MRLFSQDAKVEALRRCSLFEDLSRSDLARIAKSSEDIVVDAGRVLCREGEIGRELYVIVDGQVEVTKGETQLATLGPGEFFGELALLDHAERTATVTATSPLRFFLVTSESFWPLIDANPKLAQTLLRTVAKRARIALTDPAG